MNPFDDDAMMLIMDLRPPMEPGMHGMQEARGALDPGAVQVITQIRDLCEGYLAGAGKCEGCEEQPEEPEQEEE